MDKFTKKVLNTIDGYGMIKQNQRVIAAVSGGFDSLCMLYVLHKLQPLRKFDVCVAHVNHSFRKEADEDEKFVLETAKMLNIPAYSTKIDVMNFANSNKISFETAGRQIRYEYFGSLAKDRNSVIATAHNANDNAESFMMHLMRGSGLIGLTGIKPVMGSIIRPLIEMPRSEIEEYCRINKILPRHDITNDSDDYFRNDIRHNVMPPILERCSLNSISRTMNVLSADEEFLSKYTVSIMDKYIKKHGSFVSIDVCEFNKLHLALKRRLLRIALPVADKQNGLSHIDDVISIAQKNYGGKKSVLPGGIIAELQKGVLKITYEDGEVL